MALADQDPTLAGSEQGQNYSEQLRTGTINAWSHIDMAHARCDPEKLLSALYLIEQVIAIDSDLLSNRQIKPYFDALHTMAFWPYWETKVSDQFHNPNALASTRQELVKILDFYNDEQRSPRAQIHTRITLTLAMFTLYGNGIIARPDAPWRQGVDGLYVIDFGEKTVTVGTNLAKGNTDIKIGPILTHLSENLTDPPPKWVDDINKLITNSWSLSRYVISSCRQAMIDGEPIPDHLSEIMSKATSRIIDLALAAR